MLLLGVIMKKIIITVFIALLLTVSCIYDPNALSYGERRHSNLIPGNYVTKCGVYYELIVKEGSHQEEGNNITLSLYQKYSIGEDNAPYKIATFNGKYTHDEIIRYDYIYDNRPFYSYHIDILKFEGAPQNGYNAREFSGRVMIILHGNTGTDADDYDYNENILIRPGTEVEFIELDQYFNEEDDRSLPNSYWTYYAPQITSP